eukprot:1770428-Rhodomonas_salina.1
MPLRDVEVLVLLGLSFGRERLKVGLHAGRGNDADADCDSGGLFRGCVKDKQGLRACDRIRASVGRDEPQVDARLRGVPVEEGERTCRLTLARRGPVRRLNVDGDQAGKLKLEGTQQATRRLPLREALQPTEVEEHGNKSWLSRRSINVEVKLSAKELPQPTAPRHGQQSASPICGEDVVLTLSCIVRTAPPLVHSGRDLMWEGVVLFQEGEKGLEESVLVEAGNNVVDPRSPNHDALIVLRGREAEGERHDRPCPKVTAPCSAQGFTVKLRQPHGLPQLLLVLERACRALEGGLRDGDYGT